MIPSLPGYGFSSRPTETGWGVERIGRAWDVLMKRLGYTRYVAQGGDWGAGVVEAMGRQAPAGLLGIHTNLPAVFPPDAAEAIASGGPAPAGLSEKERAEFDAMQSFIKNGGWGYLTMMSARPQAVGYGLTDSPAGLAGWMLVHGGFGKWTYGKDPEQSPTPDEVLDNFSLSLADEHRDLGGEALLGEPRSEPDQCGRAEDRRDHAAGGHHDVSGRRSLSSPGDLGPPRLPQPDLLPRRRAGRPLPGLGRQRASRRTARLRKDLPSTPVLRPGDRHGRNWARCTQDASVALTNPR